MSNFITNAITATVAALLKPAPVAPIKRATGKREKPKQSTILKRKTANNLSYLVDHKLIAPFDHSKFLVALSSRKMLSDGTRVQDHSPTHGV